MANYWKLYKKVKAFYFNLQKIKCPALDNEEIFFDQKGFRHFLRKDKGKRPISDQIRRFVLFQHIHEVMMSARLENQRKVMYRNKENIFWSLIYYREGIKIKVVIVQIENGPKYFISIMDLK